MNERELRRRLEGVHVPGEEEASDRAWPLVRAAYEERERVRWTTSRRRPLLVLVAAGALVIAALTPPGMAVVDRVRDAVGREEPPPALVKLPSPGRLLVQTEAGPWVVNADGSKRLLGDYSGASWSPRGLFVVATSRRSLTTLEPGSGRVRWTVPRGSRAARWSGGGADTRIAYLSGSSLHVVAGDGSPDFVLAPSVAPVAPAWKGDSHVLAYADADGRVRVVNVDTRRELWVSAPSGRVQGLSWSIDQLLVLSNDTRLEVFSGFGSKAATPGALEGPSTIASVQAGDGHVIVSAGFGPILEETGELHGSLIYVDYDRDQNRSVLMLDPGKGSTKALFRGAGRFRALLTSPDRGWALVTWPAANQWVFLRLPSPSLRSPGEIGRIVAVSDVSEEFGGGPVRPLGWAPPAP